MRKKLSLRIPLIPLTLLFVLLILFPFDRALCQNGDIDMLRKINVHRNTHLDGTFKFITNSASPICIVSPLAMIGTGFVNHDKILMNKGYVSGASLLLAVGISTGLKYAFKRPRPFVTYPDIQKETSGGSYSFPSGHTTVAFATATSLSLAFQKWYVAVPAYLWAGSVAYSRMHLGVHFPTDVLGGMVIGIGSSFLCYKAQHWMNKTTN